MTCKTSEETRPRCSSSAQCSCVGSGRVSGRDLTKHLSGEKLFTAARWRLKPRLKRLVGPLCVARQHTFYFPFSSEDAFCNRCLESAARDRPSRQAGRVGCLGWERYLQSWSCSCNSQG